MKYINNRQSLFFLGVLLLSFGSFVFNIFNVGVNDAWFSNFEQGSARIVKTTAYCRDKQSFYSGPLIYKDYHGDDSVNLESCSEKDVMPYASQFGLQARLFALFAPSQLTSVERYFKYVEILLAFVSAILITFFIMKVKKQYGTKVAVITAVLLAISPWLVGYARNIYWTLPLLIAPFILTYVMYDQLKSKSSRILFYTAIGVLFLLKLLDGYEHVTTMVLSVFAVITFYEYRSISSLKKLMRPLAVVMSISIVSFIGAVSLNTIGLNEYYHDIGKSLHAVTSRADARSGTFSSIKAVQPNVIYALKVTLPDVYNTLNYYHNLDSMQNGKSNPIFYFLISVMNYTLLPALNFPLQIKGIFGVIVQSVLVAGLIGFYCITKIKQSALRERMKAAYIVSLVGALSWLVLMPAHAYPHAFLNGIIFYVPFLPFVYIAIAMYVCDRYNTLRRSSRVKSR